MFLKHSSAQAESIKFIKFSELLFTFILYLIHLIRRVFSYTCLSAVMFSYLSLNTNQTCYPQHDWNKYLELVFSNTSVKLHPQQDRVIVMDLPYLQKLAVLLTDTKPVIVGESRCCAWSFVYAFLQFKPL